MQDNTLVWTEDKLPSPDGQCESNLKGSNIDEYGLEKLFSDNSFREKEWLVDYDGILYWTEILNICLMALIWRVKGLRRFKELLQYAHSHIIRAVPYIFSFKTCFFFCNWKFNPIVMWVCRQSDDFEIYDCNVY